MGEKEEKRRKGKKEKERGVDKPKINIDLGIINLSGLFDMVNKIVDLGVNLKDLESELQSGEIGKRVHIDSEVRVGGLLGDSGIRIGSGNFIKRLDELAKERGRWRGRVSASGRMRGGVSISPSDVVRTEMAADVIERDDRVYVLTQVPYEREEIQVSFRRREGGGELCVEAPKQGYRRLIPINVEVDLPEGREVEWSYRNNVVEAVLPKSRKKEE